MNSTSDQENSYVNVSAYLTRMALARPYQRAVVYPAGRDPNGRVSYAHLTFQQLDRESDRLAHGLVKAGLTRGTRTILMVKPSLEFLALAFAMFKCGAVPVVVDPGMGIRRMVSCFNESRPAAFIGIPLAHVIRTLFPKDFQTVKIWITVGRRWFWGGLTLKQIRQTTGKPFPAARTRSDEMAAILFTTGSTGPAKGAVYTHGNFEAQIHHIRSRFNIEPGEIDLPTFPLYALFDPALGMTAVIPDMDPTRPAYVDQRKIINTINDHGVTNLPASPALLNRVGSHGKQFGIKLPSLKRVITTGAPISPDNIEQFSSLLEKDTEIHPGYGATEAMPVASIGSHEILSETRQYTERGHGVCVGRPVDNIEVRIIKISDGPIQQWSDDILVQDGDVGEITVKGNMVTREYFEKPQADRLAKIKDNADIWHRMGDLGWMDSKGRIWFCGRKSHRVITADKTLFTIPCESLFNQHPRVFRSALVGLGPSGRQEPVICIELHKSDDGKNRGHLENELLEIAAASELTKSIKTILFHKAFPVDIRHNSKIFREKLALWAEKKLKWRQIIRLKNINPQGF
jgi:acyl-CoA synthetase (AMP-forming)/AMP-acid ligase II